LKREGCNSDHRDANLTPDHESDRKQSTRNDDVLAMDLGCVYDSLLIDPIFVDIHACMRQYLAELYASMGDEKSAMALL